MTSKIYYDTVDGLDTVGTSDTSAWTQTGSFVVAGTGGASLAQIAYDSTNNRLWANDSNGSGNLLVYDCTDNSLIQTITPEFPVLQLVVLPSVGKVYAVEASGQVEVFSSSTYMQLAVITDFGGANLSSNPPGADNAGKRLFVQVSFSDADPTGEIYRINCTSDTITGSFTISDINGDFSTGMYAHQVTGHLYVGYVQFGTGIGMMAVYDPDALTLIHNVSGSFSTTPIGRVAADELTELLYVSNKATGTFGVSKIDMSVDALVGTYSAPAGPASFFYSQLAWDDSTSLLVMYLNSDAGQQFYSADLTGTWTLHAALSNASPLGPGTFFLVVTAISPISSFTNQGSYAFSHADIGRYLTAYVTDHTGLAVSPSVIVQKGLITGITDAYTVTLATGGGAPTIIYESDPSSIGWTITDTPDPTCTIYGVPTIDYLAADTGAAFNQSEDASRQRALIRDLRYWAAQKGAAEAYRILGLLSGWTVTTQQLFRLDFTQWGGAAYLAGSQGGLTPDGLSHAGLAAPLSVPRAPPYGFDPADPGTVFGSRGSLSYVGGYLTLTDLAANTLTGQFNSAMVGSNLTIAGATGAALNKIYTIRSVPNSFTLHLASEDYIPVSTYATSIGQMTLPDASDGALVWAVTKYYSLVPPQFGSFDDIDMDLWQYGSDGVYPYRYADWMWQAAPTGSLIPSVYLYASAVTQTAPTKWTLTFGDCLVVRVALNFPFAVGETVTQSTTGATGVVVKELDIPAFSSNPSYSLLWLKTATNTFSPNSTPYAITGGSGGLGNGGYVALQSLGSIVYPDYFETTGPDGNAYYLDRPLTQTNPTFPATYTAPVTSVVTPQVGIYSVQYNRPTMVAGGLTGDSVVYLTIHNESSEISQAQFLNRIADATPVHVRLIVEVV